MRLLDVAGKSAWLNQNCGFYTIFNFWECLFFYSDFTFIIIGIKSEKCAQYWSADKNEHKAFENFEVTALEEIEADENEFIIRKLQIKSKNNATMQ